MILPAALAIAAGLSAPLSADDAVKLTLVPKGGMAKIGYYAPQRAPRVAEKPAGITKAPEGMGAAQYGKLAIGGGDGIAFILDEPDGKDPALYIDANRNGDLTDDAKIEWKVGKNKMASGAAMVDIGEKDKPLLVNISLYRFDKAARPQLKDVVLYYRDYAYTGDVKLGEKTYKAVLSDEMAKGDFRGAKAAEGEDARSGVQLLLDVNGNGKFDAKGESFDIAKPFNIGGTTYEIADMTRDGSSFKVVKSDKTVAEIPTPPDMSVGSVFPSFEAKDTEGKMVKFPEDYKGKVVLVDFWATWCGPCMGEMPNVVAAYAKYHDKGFEIQGVSLDNERSIAKMPEVMKENKMTWRQVADGKGWEAAIAQKYAIQSIPATFLVDGTTGKILGADLRGEALDKALDKALAKDVK